MTATPQAPPADAQEAAPAPATGSSAPSDVTAEAIHVNPAPDKANFWDIFMGEESSNYKSVDVAKLQMLLFSVITIVSYTVAIIVQVQANQTSAFPAINAGLVTLMGISHAGYLTHKGIPK